MRRYPPKQWRIPTCSFGICCMSSLNQCWSWPLPSIFQLKLCCLGRLLKVKSEYQSNKRLLTESGFLWVACVLTPHVLEIGGANRTVSIKDSIKWLKVCLHNCRLVISAAKRCSRIKEWAGYLEVSFACCWCDWSWCERCWIRRNNWLRIGTRQTSLGRCAVAGLF